MSAARKKIINAFLKQNVCSRLKVTHSRYLSSSQNAGTEAEAAAAVTSHALINPRKTVSDFQELYEATKKKFQCKPYNK